MNGLQTVTIAARVMLHRNYPRYGPWQELCGSNDWTIAVRNHLAEFPTVVVTVETPGSGKISGTTTQYKAVVE